jgi:hypothetical protein
VTRSVSLNASSIPRGDPLRRGKFLFGRVRFQLTDYLLAAPVFCAPLLDERSRDVGPRVVRALGGGAGVRARIPCDEFCLTRLSIATCSLFAIDAPPAWIQPRSSSDGRGVRVLELQLAARDKPSARECSATYRGEEKAPRLASILAESRPEDAPANPAPPQKRILVIAITSRIQRPR